MEPLTKTLEGSVEQQVQFRVLYLFSGPVRLQDGFERFCRDLGMKCTCIDVEYDVNHDLLSQDVWEALEGELDNYDAFLMSPPCCTFSMARTGGGGPSPLRGKGRDRYGLRNLSVEDRGKVREGTLLAKRAHTTARRAQCTKKPWILEQPHWREDGTSMYMLDEFVELAKCEGVSFHTFDQCEFGCDFEKTTDILSNIDDDIMEPFHSRCSHDEQWWIVPWNGQTKFSKHPPLRGRQIAIPYNEWDPKMLRDEEPRGQYLTRSTAAYPLEMNKQLALCIKKACERLKSRAVTVEAAKPGVQNSAHQVESLDPGVTVTQPLTGQLESFAVDDRNGLRNIHKWISSMMLFVGKQVQNLLESVLDDNPLIQERLLGSLGENKSFPDEIQQAVDVVRCQVKELLVRNRLQGMPTQCSTEQVDTEEYRTVIRGELLSYWAQCVEDPGYGISRWLIDGAPAGISCNTDDLDGVCPKVEDEQQDGLFDLTTDYESFVNYSGVEENEDAYTAIQSYAEKGYLKVFDTLAQLEQHVGAKPTLSKIGCIIKQKVNHLTGTVTNKTRIILDCKRSMVSKVATRTHKSVLPRVSDAIQSTLTMQSDCRQDESITLLVADVVDAFWLIPLRKEERRYFCAKLRGKYYCFHRTAQGSRAAPLTFAAVIALASRWVQSVVATPRRQGLRTEEARVQTYVDDPLFTIRGTEHRQKRLTATILMAWMVMGFPLAVHKATLSTKLTWIGVELSILQDGIEAVVPQEKVLELSDLLTKVLQCNVTPKKTLRTIIGKAMSIASVLYCWRPFIQELYTALYVTDTQAPKECIWTKQVKHTVIWLLTFLQGEMAGIRRVYTMRTFQNQLPMVTITWDASPFGMGATLQFDGVFIEYFAIKISSEDEKILGVPAGCHEGQQTWEALAGLVALRHWSMHWQGQRARLHIRSDNVGALVMLTKLKGGSKPLALIAREYALDLGQAQWKPDVISHVPGISNTTCDALSHDEAPGAPNADDWGARRRFGFLPQVPAVNLIARQEQWRKDVEIGDPNERNAGILVSDRKHHSDKAEGGSFENRSKRKRGDMPIVRRVDKGDLDRAFSASINAESRQSALDHLLSDMYAATSKKPRDALLKTWVKLHTAWFGEDGQPPFPMTEITLIRVSAMFKSGGYKSFKNYLSRAKDHHLQLGYQWTESLNRTSQKCARSVLRGLAGAARSEAFDLKAVVKCLDGMEVQVVDGCPAHPLALVVCATFFMLRELEASAVDRADVMFNDGSVTLSLPVPKTDWEAKGCKRTWLAAQRSGMQIRDSDGQYRLSGHTFRITGARFLSAAGLDPITIQLLGRWGSSAVLTYLAEAPLMSLNHRLKPLDSQRLTTSGSADDVRFGELDRRVNAIEMLEGHRRWCDELNQVRQEIISVRQDLENHSDQLRGVSLVLEDRQIRETKKVINTTLSLKGPRALEEIRPASHRASPDLLWECIRNSSCFVRPGGVNKRRFSAEPGNLLSLHSLQFSGLANDKALDVRPKKVGKKESIELVQSAAKTTLRHRPGSILISSGLNKCKKKGLRRLDREILGTSYRPALHKLARLKYLKIRNSFKKPKPRATQRLRPA
eukprot:s1069_g8.t1